MRLIGCVIISLLCCFHGNAQEKAIILKNVNVVDVVEGSIRKGQDVVIKEGIIQAVGKGAGTGVSGEVKDLTGMYVMPGLIDAHVHIQMTRRNHRRIGRSIWSISYATG